MKAKTRNARRKPDTHQSKVRWPTWTSVVLLVAIGVIAYGSVWRCGFVNFDDKQYVVENVEIAKGLNLHVVIWAFTTGHATNWHPLTWLSHMVDIDLFGLNPGPQHLVNLALHVTNTILLFWFLLRTTKALGCSVAVAAFFAVHPLHVESVAWISERKDVLSTLFWLLTMNAYVSYVTNRSRLSYIAVCGLFAAGLMAKPMLVTLPVVLLLIDLWPLQRWTTRIPSWVLIREKLPLFALSCVSSIVTFFVQRKEGAVATFSKVPLTSRVANAIVAYVTYLARMLWPTRLSALYPMTAIPLPECLAAACILVVISILAIRAIGSRPYILVGWLWYLGTLVPVIGLIQVGSQATADRYTYVPLIGIFIIVCFGCADLVEWWNAPKSICVATCGLAILSCVALTREQVRYWTNSKTLWEHALAVTDRNAVAQDNMGDALEQEGDLSGAIGHYSEALRIEPEYAPAHQNMGTALEHRGELNAAIAQYREALRIGPEAAEVHFDLGEALAKIGTPEALTQAEDHLAQAINMMPDLAEAHNTLGLCYLMQGELNKASGEFSESIRLKPNDGSAHNNLATTLGSQGRFNEAVPEYREAIRLVPNYSDAYDNLGMLLAKQGDASGAKTQFLQALRINASDNIAKRELAKLTAKTDTGTQKQ